MGEFLAREYEFEAGVLPDRLPTMLALDISREKLNGLYDALGPDGPGSFCVPEVLNPEQLVLMREEIFDADCVAMRDNHDQFVNGRGMLVIENHTVYALKIGYGDQSYVEKVPRMHRLARNVEEFVHGLSCVFPPLDDWTLNEMSLHRYDDQEIGLSFHKDNLCFFGLVGVLTLEGERDFRTLDDDGVIHNIEVSEGDLVLTRVNGLYPAMPSTYIDENGKEKDTNICPDHAAMNLKTPFSTSFIVRYNTKPERPIKGFEFDNWPA